MMPLVSNRSYHVGDIVGAMDNPGYSPHVVLRVAAPGSYIIEHVPDVEQYDWLTQRWEPYYCAGGYLYRAKSIPQIEYRGPSNPHYQFAAASVWRTAPEAPAPAPHTHSVVDTGTRRSFCRTCDATLEFRNWEWVET